MKKKLLTCFFVFSFVAGTINSSFAQCSICTKTAQQLGEKPAQGMNTGIIYLALAPFAIIGFVGYNWWKKQKNA